MVGLIQGDSREVLRTLETASVDAVVCDPPYEISFMGRRWDSTGVAYDVNLWAECLRVLKPGGRLLAFGGSRTYHRLACAVEDAGFYIADQLQWLYGSGFPKSLDIGKALDKRAGITEWAETRPNPAWRAGNGIDATTSTGWAKPQRPPKPVVETPEAQQWDGWGTALKPMHEPVVFAIKPLDGTYAANVLKWGCGGLNIDGSRIGTDGRPLREKTGERWQASNMESCGSKAVGDTTLGRWPGNVLLDPEAAAELDRQSGDGTGGASRFFYRAKAARWERDFGLDGFEVKRRDLTRSDPEAPGCNNPRNRGGGQRTNHHPTVKPVALLRWLCRLVTPPGGIVLDPFMGSGSCGIAAKLEGFGYIGIELDAEYVAIAEARIAAWEPGSEQDEKTRSNCGGEVVPDIEQMPLPLEATG